MDVSALRRETRLDHASVESSMPLMRPDLDRDLYLDVLRRLFGIVRVWERTINTHLPARLAPLAEERNRLQFLEEDLRALGVTDLNLPQPTLPHFENLAESLGAMYVMEGSRLGGQFIARHVESVLDLSQGKGSQYFRGFGETTGRRWNEFSAALEREVPEAATADAIRGAKKMFAAFGEWMRFGVSAEKAAQSA